MEIKTAQPFLIAARNVGQAYLAYGGAYATRSILLSLMVAIALSFGLMLGQLRLVSLKR